MVRPGRAQSKAGARRSGTPPQRLDAGSPPALTFAAVAVVILAVDLCAMWIPARLAARVDPATALRAE